MRKLLLVLAFAAACDRGAAPPAPRATKAPKIKGIDVGPATHPIDTPERGNLLNIAFGASVVSRTAELTLEQSAVRAIDGDPNTTWTSPPDDGPNQMIVFALPARTHAQQVGIQTPSIAMFHAGTVQLDSSLDGVNFAPLVTFTPDPKVDDPQVVAASRDLVYLRLTTLKVPGKFARINSVVVRGRFAEPVAQKPLTGCWTINDLAAQFATDRGRVIGTIAYDQPISFEGGSDGLVYRLIWVSGNNRGFAAIDTSPDGKHLSGIRWYEEPMEYSSAESWFGQRSGCTAPIPHEDAMASFLRLKHRVPLFALHFEPRGTLVESDSAAALEIIANFARQASARRLRLVSREYRLGGADANRHLAQARLDSLRSVLQKRGIDAKRFDWQVLGEQNPPSKIETEIQRNLYSAIELATE